MSDAPWKLSLVPASYNGATFYVELQTRAGGFRLVPHEIPKADVGWTESMGKRVRHWAITGYLIYSPSIMPDVFGARDMLIAALETPGTGTLILPTGLQDMSDCPPGAVVVDSYSVIERQERGGWCSVEMIFVQAGQLSQGGTASNQPTTDTSSASAAQAVNTMVASNNSSDMGFPAYSIPGSGQAAGFGYPSYGIGPNQALSVASATPLGQSGIGHQ